MSTKEHIDILVRDYVKNYPQEWNDFQKSIKEKLSLSKDEFGIMEGSELIERKLYEIPETLYTILKLRLSLEDWDWYQAKEGARWFASHYPQFRTSEKT